MKRALSFVLSLVMGFSVLTVSASAAQKPDGSPAQETFSIKGRQASSAMVEMLEEEGITVTEDTVIELVPLSSTESGIAPLSSDGGNDGSALVIINKEGTKVTKDVLALVAADGTGFVDMSAAVARGGNSHDFEITGKVMIHGTAVYNQYEDDWYLFTHPEGVKVKYTKYNTCNVSNISMVYICSGASYSYPDFKFVANTVDYSIRVSKASPVAGTTYSKSQPYRSDRVIYTGAGSTSPGNHLTYTAEIDGKTYSVTAGV